MASRLSEDPTVSALVLEKGRVNDTLLSRIPLASQGLLDGGKRQVVSDHFTEPVVNANGLRRGLDE